MQKIRPRLNRASVLLLTTVILWIMKQRITEDEQLLSGGGRDIPKFSAKGSPRSTVDSLEAVITSQGKVYKGC